MNREISVRYLGPIDAGLDKKIKMALESIGAKWTVKGRDLKTSMREMNFGIEPEETTNRELINKLSEYSLDAKVNIEVVGQSGSYTIGNVWMNKDNGEVYILGTV